MSDHDMPDDWDEEEMIRAAEEEEAQALAEATRDAHNGVFEHKRIGFEFHLMDNPLGDGWSRHMFTFDTLENTVLADGTGSMRIRFHGQEAGSLSLRQIQRTGLCNVVILACNGGGTLIDPFNEIRPLAGHRTLIASGGMTFLETRLENGISNTEIEIRFNTQWWENEIAENGLILPMITMGSNRFSEIQTRRGGITVPRLNFFQAEYTPNAQRIFQEHQRQVARNLQQEVDRNIAETIIPTVVHAEERWVPRTQRRQPTFIDEKKTKTRRNRTPSEIIDGVKLYE